MKQQGSGKRLLVKVGIVATAVATCWAGLANAGTTTTVPDATGVRPTGAVCPTTPNVDDGRPEIVITKCGENSANPMDAIDDTAAIEFATNQLNAVAGGGHVYFPPAQDGAYLVHNVDQRSNVDYYGSAAATTTLKRLATADPSEPMLKGQLWTTTGSIAKNSAKLNVADASKVAVGSVIAVHGAGGPNPTQTSTLSLPILSGSTTLGIRSGGHGAADWAYVSESRYLVVDDELISYGRQSGNTFSGLVRGVHGVAATHATGATVSQALQLVAEVTAVSGSTITLDRAAKLSVSRAAVTVGSSNMSVRNLTLDGNQPKGTYAAANPWPMHYMMARRLLVTGCVITNGDNGGIRLEHGSRDARIERNTFINNGEEAAPGSGHVWLFQGVVRTVVNDNRMSGVMKQGVVIDDRTEHATGWDAPSTGNEVTANTIDMQEDPSIGPNPGPVGVSIFGAWAPDGGSRNVVSGNTLIANQSVAGGGIGVEVGTYTQGTSPLNSNTVQVSGNSFAGQQLGIRTNGINNTFVGNSFAAIDTAACQEHRPATGNTWANNGAGCSPLNG